MGISDRIQGTLENWATLWSARLGKWAGAFIASGIDGFMRILGKSFSPLLTPIIKKLQASGEIPPELEPLLAEMLKPTGESAAGLLASAGNRVIGGAVGKIADALLIKLAYAINRAMPNMILGPDEIIAMNWRRGIPEADTIALLANHGLDPLWAKALIELKELRFPSDIVNELWHRDPNKYKIYEKDLTAIGITPDRQQALWQLSYKMPTVRDVVSFLAHEVFEPKMIAKYGLDDEWGELDKTMFEKVGMKEEIALDYWRDHWQHASWSQVRDMLHRGILTEQDVYDWFRLVEIPPYWRAGLTKTMWDVPGRIEVRMMAQLGLVDKAFIMDILKKDGLAEEYRSIVADMNLVRGIRTDIQARYTKKWIDSDGVKAELAKSGLSPQVADRLYQWIVSNAKPDRTTAEKDLTVAQITKAVKRGDIPWEDGIARLMLQGYDEDEADLIMMQAVEVVEAEPTTELNTRVDTIRRQRRQRLITRDQEMASLVYLGLDTGLAAAYADNDDLRLVKETAGGA
jgi:hypothetical protein